MSNLTELNWRAKEGSGPIPGNSHSFPITAGIFLPLVSLWDYPAHKNWQTYTLGPLLPSQMGHTPCRECVTSLNKSSFTLPWLTLELFPAWSQEPTSGGHSRDLAMTWDMIIPWHHHPSLSCNPRSRQQHGPFWGRHSSFHVAGNHSLTVSSMIECRGRIPALCRW